MILNIHYNREGDDYDDVEVVLNNEDLAVLLACDGICYNGGYYRINSKIFEFLDNKKSLTVIAKYDLDVTV